MPKTKKISVKMIDGSNGTTKDVSLNYISTDTGITDAVLKASIMPILDLSSYTYVDATVTESYSLNEATT